MILKIITESLDSALNSITKLKSFHDFVSYVQYTTSSVSVNSKKYKFYDSELLDSHRGKSILLLDKYILTAIPDPQLEFLLENQNIYNFNADWYDFGNRFKLSVCVHDSEYSEILTPNIRAERYNPYKRWMSCVNSGNKTCNNLLDLCGINIRELGFDNHENILLDVVCTFPSEIDVFLVNPAVRDMIIKRMNKCEKSFFKVLESMFCPSGNSMGMSSNLHLWSSEIPVLPNGHIHNLIPFFSYNNKESVIEFNESWLDPKYKRPIGTRVRDISIVYPEIRREEFVSPINNFITVVENGINRRTKTKFFGSFDIPVKHTIESPRVEKFIVDSDYSDFQSAVNALSIDMAEYFNFKPCVWDNRSYPVDAEKIKTLWSDIVYNEFYDILDNWISLDVHIQFISVANKSKLLHALQYKCRPPVLDLDLFFKECPDFIVYYDSFDSDKILDYINYKLKIAINCSNYNDICRYESLLKRATNVFSRYDSEIIFNWMEYLTVYKTQTRVYGFWRDFKTFQLDPNHDLFPHNPICPICDGEVSFFRNVCSYDVDAVIIRHRSNFMIFECDGG